ncbi:ankyrin repeat domain-containing protein [uncultured Adlercreutzia sp.]|uniref:ankyrin repeat domain-containing protein n=1 Tax=uncultured Adlercreutzia sp. TaxID=875803 RepID=UPI0026F3FFC5|nr:ankyrin repeat domain-containing protein [uncultured Adlercreutzia sp.]
MAAGAGDTAALSNYLEKDLIDVNLPDSDGDTALYWATCRRRTEAIKLLLEAGANPNQAGKSGSPLRVAAALGARDLVSLLISHGATIESDFAIGTPLNMAVKQSQEETVSLLLEHGADPNSRSTELLETPLMVAASLCNENMIRMLLRAGADARAEDRDGDTAIDYFALSGNINTPVAKLLLLNGGSIDRLYSRGYILMKQGSPTSLFQRWAVNDAALRDPDVELCFLPPQSSLREDFCV